MSEVILHVLGTAQDAGLPHPNCYCENCTAAIRNPQFKRFASSLAIVQPEEKTWQLIDATPDLKDQLIRVQTKFNMQGQLMDCIFLTHAHISISRIIIFGTGSDRGNWFACHGRQENERNVGNTGAMEPINKAS